MACSNCRKSGHNCRTCTKLKEKTNQINKEYSNPPKNYRNKAHKKTQDEEGSFTFCGINADWTNRKTEVSNPTCLLREITNTLGTLHPDFAVVSEVGKNMSSQIVSTYNENGCNAKLGYDSMALIWSPRFKAESGVQSRKDRNYIGGDYIVSEYGKYMGVMGTFENKKLLLLGTHLPHKRGRLQSLQNLCKFVEEAKARREIDEVVVVGDFNSNKSSIMKYLAEGIFAFDDDQFTTETGFARDNIIVQNYDLRHSRVHTSCQLFSHFPITSVLRLED